MTAPTFVQEAETAWTSTSTTRVTGTFTVQANDVLVALWVCENNVKSVSISNSGTAFTWTSQQEVSVTDYTRVRVYTAIASVGQAMTVTFTTTGGLNEAHGGNVLTFRDSDGVGASSKTNVSSGAPSLSLTTTQAESAIVVANGDWNAADGASRTWRTVNSITPTSGNGLEVTYFRDAARYAVYGAYYSDAGATGSKTVGLSAPSGQKYGIVAVEVKGTAAAGGGSRIIGPRYCLVGPGGLVA